MISLLGSMLAIAMFDVVAPAPIDVARQALSAFAHEPSVRQVQRAALAYAGLHPRVLRGLRTRARWAAAVPDPRFRITRTNDDGARAETDFERDRRPREVSATETRDHRLRLEGEVRWYPGEMVFRDQEAKLIRENRHTAHERQQLLEAVTRLYFERRRAQLGLSASVDVDVDGATRALMLLDIQQMTAELDALTGGAFSRQLAAGYRP